MLISLFIILFGLAVGSFLNVVIARLDSNQSFWRGRSHCPKCQTLIVWYDNIPLLSFSILRGRCRHCHQPISWQYPAIEFTTAVIFFILYQKFGLGITWLTLVTFVAFLLIIFVYDLKTYLIADSITIPAMVVAAVLNWYVGVNIWNLLIGAVIGGAFFGLQFYLSKGTWVGDGDIRLGVVMGLMLGWQLLLLALLLAYVVGAVVGLVLIAFHKKTMSSAVPFGPFLAGATIITLLYGQQLLSWYLNFLNI